MTPPSPTPNAELVSRLAGGCSEIEYDLGRKMTSDEFSLFTLGFRAGCEAKSDQIQPQLTHLELMLSGKPSPLSHPSFAGGAN